jgi:hypothetical protein
MLQAGDSSGIFDLHLGHTAVRHPDTSQPAKQAALSSCVARCVAGEAGRLLHMRGDSGSGVRPIVAAHGELEQVCAAL